MSETSCWIGLFSKFVNFHLVKSGNRQEITRKNNVVQGGKLSLMKRSKTRQKESTARMRRRFAALSASCWHKSFIGRKEKAIRWVGMISTKRNELFMNAFYLVPTFHSLWGWDMFLTFSETFPTETLVSCSQNYPWQVRIGHGTKSKCTARGRRNISWETTSRPSAYRKATLRRTIVIPTAFGTGAAVFQTGFRKIADIRQRKSKNAIWNCQSEIQTLVERWVVASELC